jgi:hypothetical protein
MWFGLGMKLTLCLRFQQSLALQNGQKYYNDASQNTVGKSLEERKKEIKNISLNLR